MGEVRDKGDLEDSHNDAILFYDDQFVVYIADDGIEGKLVAQVERKRKLLPFRAERIVRKKLNNPLQIFSCGLPKGEVCFVHGERDWVYCDA